MENDYPLRSLFLYLTDRCNLCCSHCWISPEVSKRRQDGIPLEALKRVIQDAKALGLQNVKLTGGEPLLYRYVEPLLSFLAAEALTITVETNGTLITKGLAKRLRDSGVSQVAVSLDGASA